MSMSTGPDCSYRPGDSSARRCSSEAADGNEDGKGEDGKGVERRRGGRIGSGERRRAGIGEEEIERNPRIVEDATCASFL